MKKEIVVTCKVHGPLTKEETHVHGVTFLKKTNEKRQNYRCKICGNLRRAAWIRSKRQDPIFRSKRAQYMRDLRQRQRESNLQNNP